MQVVLFLVKQALLLYPGLPIPFPAQLYSLGEDGKILYIDKVAQVLDKEVQDCANDEIKDAFRGVCAALDIADTAQTVQDTRSDLSSRGLCRLTSSSYESLRNLLLSLEGVHNPPPGWRPRYTGMEFIGPSIADGCVSWVSGEGREEFMRRGRGALVRGGR
jgi:hypothetical protein